MKNIIIEITSNDENVHLEGFYDETLIGPRAAMIILPGGAYNHCAPIEGVPVAKYFAEKGYAAFVLNYSTRYGTRDNIGGALNPHTLFPEPLRQVGASIKAIRENATNLNICPNKIVLVGFSAGGHLAACYSALWSSEPVYRGLVNTPMEIQPDACVLIYGAFSMSNNDVMMKAIYGDREYTQEEIDRYSADKLISATTPPTFLFHSIPDPMVPYASSLEYFLALREAGVTSELHLCSQGGHAYGLGDVDAVTVWPQLAHQFLNDVFERS